MFTPMGSRAYATDLEDHDSRHITGGVDEIDGDKLDIDFNPSYSTPATTPAEASSVDNLTAHLYGIDQVLGGLKYTNIWIPAGAMIPNATAGAQLGTYEFATQDINKDYFAFDGASEEFVEFSLVMDERWDRGTFKSKFYWSPGDAACTAGDTVEWEIQAGALSNDDAIDAALGTARVISDIVLAGKNADLHISDATPVITCGGTPALGDLISFKISRNVSGTDDMTEDAWLWGLFIQIATSNIISAW